MVYHLTTYEFEQGARAALVIDQQLFDLYDVSGRNEFKSVLGILNNWEQNRTVLDEIVANLGKAHAKQLGSAALLSPILYPPAVFCAGANFPDHVANMHVAHGLPVPENPKSRGIPPFHFLKVSRCCVGTGATVKALSPAFDYEVELVAVIGKSARNVSVSEALDYVAGYMVGNDLSARDIGFRRQLARDDVFFHSWLVHKSFEDSAPIGPWITPKEFLPHWSELRVKTLVNGELRQDGSCGEMYYSLEDQIAELSKVITLQPGDIIMTGTPGGVGAETGQFLKSGDVVEVSIEGIGSVVTPIA